ncbi:MAG: Anion-transporting ATPase-like domain protein, partial [Gemmatimonadetes bacterium]|nr:Anion-transporting ATPase-like domain protein [Gemmatimonadota bacterium]
MSGAAALLDQLPPWVLVVGKGGVGKTTCAAALAIADADRGTTTLVLSTDPARALSDALGAPLAADPLPIAGAEHLSAFQLDAAVERDRFLEQWREVLVTIVDRGTYLERGDVTSLVDGALPGVDETMALLRLAELATDDRWRRILIDTAPTGHTLRLLDLPRSFTLLLSLLDAMQDKHRFMVRALMHRYRTDDADAFLTSMRARVSSLTRLLGDRARCAAVLVTREEPVVLAESVRYARALAERGITVGAVVVNASGDGESEVAGADDGSSDAGALIAELRIATPHATWRRVERGAVALGVDGAREWGARLVGDAQAHRATSASAAPSAERDIAASSARGARAPRGIDLLSPLPALTIVGGKGGVGKTTVACALALTAAAPSLDTPVLLVSTDPAPSLADALEQPIGDEEVPVAGVPGLFARQADAIAAFERLRSGYAERVDALFDALSANAIDTTADRRIVRDLLALAPPGIDELYALAAIADAVGEQRFARVIVDPAPTGHLLRLLEMPAIALDWTHQLMRLVLRYRELGALGDVGADLLSLAHRIRAVGALLRDPARASLIVVALDEPLVRRETRRLTDAVAGLGVSISGVVWNRSASGTTLPALPLPAAATAAQLVAFETQPSPRG